MRIHNSRTQNQRVILYTKTGLKRFSKDFWYTKKNLVKNICKFIKCSRKTMILVLNYPQSEIRKGQEYL